MSKGLTIIDKDYTQWVENLSVRYRQSQIKAAVRVNRELLKYYWELGRDIEEMHVEERWGQSVIKNLSVDLQLKNPNSTGLSRTNIYYAKKFYLLYSQHLKVVPQTVGQLEDENGPQSAEDSSEVVPQPVGQLKEMLFSIPWGHHRYLIDRYGTEPEKAFFYVKKTMKEGWSRDVLLNFMDSGLYEREGKALTNFTRTLPDEASDLAQELTKDPYNFAFTGITKPYINLSCYVVIEVKIGEFDFQDLGQLSGYVVACNHILKKEGRDNPTIGLLICRQKDSLLAQYALEGSNLPLGISEYELSKLYPKKVDGTIPTIEEIEAKLGNKDKS